MTILRATLLAVMLVLPAALRAEMVLLMAEQPGCYWCQRWDTDIAAIYPKTDEGSAAPLQRYNIREGLPQGITVSARVQYTPTFVLLRDGVEHSRIEGYPGEDFFWGLLGQMLEDAQG